jgi:hypothetical protein
MLTWIDLLNAETCWSCQEDMESCIFGLLLNAHDKPRNERMKFSETQAQKLVEALTYMRYQLAALHFGKPADLSWLNDRLKNCRLELRSKTDSSKQMKAHPGTAGKGSHGHRPHINLCQTEHRLDHQLPSLQAITSENSIDSLLGAFIDTYLIQFASFIASALDGAPIYTVSRCEGLHKKANLSENENFYRLYESLEAKWFAELPESNEGLTIMELARCADFFIQKGKGKFCSDPCRFSTFAVRKQLTEPDYLRQKQKRYRHKQK